MSEADEESARNNSQNTSFDTSSFDSEETTGIMETIQSVNVWIIKDFKSNLYYSYTLLKGRIMLYPSNGASSSISDLKFTGLSFYMPNNTKLRYRLCIMDNNQSPCNIVEGVHFFHRRWNQGCFLPQFLSRTYLRDQKMNILPNDTLTLAIELDIYHDYQLDCQNYDHTLLLANNIASLYNIHDFSDVKLKAGEKVFYAHKNILAARSSVFAAMFRHEMKENVENVVPIKDINVEVLNEMLYYIYTGNVKDMNMSMAQELLVVSDKYDIPGLKMISGKVLEKKLTVTNVIDMLILADSHNAIELKKNIIDYLAVNIKEVMETSEFKRALNSHLSLVISTIEKVINLRVT